MSNMLYFSKQKKMYVPNLDFDINNKKINKYKNLFLFKKI